MVLALIVLTLIFQRLLTAPDMISLFISCSELVYLSDAILRWIICYLKNRYQIVDANGVLSAQKMYRVVLYSAVSYVPFFFLYLLIHYLEICWRYQNLQVFQVSPNESTRLCDSFPKWHNKCVDNVIMCVLFEWLVRLPPLVRISIGGAIYCNGTSSEYYLCYMLDLQKT